MTPSQRHMLFRFYMATTALSVVVLIALIIAQVYVRWAINQNFSFLPGAGFEAIVALVLGELLGLAYLLKE